MKKLLQRWWQLLGFRRNSLDEQRSRRNPRAKGDMMSKPSNVSLNSMLSSLLSLAALQRNLGLEGRGSSSFEKLPGVLFIGLLAAVAMLSAGYISGLSASLVALLLGAAIANTHLGSRSLPSSFKPGIKFCEKKILEVAIVLMGLSISLSSLAADIALLPVLAAIAAPLIIGLVVAKRLGYQPGTSALVGIGCAICGSAAIAASQKPLKSDQADIANALAGIHIIGFAALLVLPIAAKLLDLTPQHSALLIGGSLPAMGHVVAAGFSLAPEVGEQATLIKLARITMLAPLLVGLYLWQPSGSSGEAAGTNSKGWRKALGAIPLFIFAFVALVLLRSVVEVPEQILSTSGTISTVALTMALAAIGCQLRIKETLQKTTRALQLTAGIMAVQLGVLWLLS